MYQFGQTIAIYSYFSQATEDEPNAKNFRMSLNDFNALSRNKKAIFHSKIQFNITGFNQVLSLHNNGLSGHDEFIALERTFLKISLCPETQQYGKKLISDVPSLFSQPPHIWTRYPRGHLVRSLLQ